MDALSPPIFPSVPMPLAQQVARRLPDLIALQEVTLIRRQSPGDFIVGGSVPATSVEADHLAILMNALERYGAHYAIVSQVQDTDVEMPLPTSATTFDDLRLTDRDVILMRTDLPPGLPARDEPARRKLRGVYSSADRR
jgi:hypothetical protein